MADPAVVLDSQNVVVEANPAFFREISPLVNEKRSFTNNFIHPDDISVLTSLLATFRKPAPDQAVLPTKYLPSVYQSAEPTQKPVKCRIQTLTLASGMPRYVTYEWGISQHPLTRQLLLVGRNMEEKVRDISKAAEFEDFFENAPIALHWLSGEGIVLWANQTEMDFLGYTKEEYIGQSITKFCVDEAVVLEIFKTLGSGNTIHDVPVRMRHKDGTIKHILVDSNVNYHPDGTFHHTRCFIRDDTARKLKEERLKLELEGAEQAVKAKEDFFSSVAHDLRTPMQALLGTVQLLTETHLSDAQQDYISTILSSGSELCTMLDNIVDTIRSSQAVPMKLNLEPMDIKSDIENTIKRMASLLHDKDVLLSFAWHGSTASRVPNWVMGDSGSFKRVLINLIGNAIKFTERGFITVTVKYDKADPDGLPYKFCVVDTGKGIAKTDLPFVFKQYWQKAPEPGAANKEVLGVLGTGGAGLGLHICEMVVKAMGGKIGVDSCQDPGRNGSTFWFKLPLQTITDPTFDPTSHPSSRNQSVSGDPVMKETAVADPVRRKDVNMPQMHPESSRRVQEWVANVPYAPGEPMHEYGAASNGRPSRRVSDVTQSDDGRQANRNFAGMTDIDEAIEAIMRQSQAAIENIMRAKGALPPKELAAQMQSVPPVYPVPAPVSVGVKSRTPTVSRNDLSKPHSNRNSQVYPNGPTPLHRHSASSRGSGDSIIPDPTQDAYPRPNFLPSPPTSDGYLKDPYSHAHPYPGMYNNSNDNPAVFRGYLNHPMNSYTPPEYSTQRAEPAYFVDNASDTASIVTVSETDRDTLNLRVLAAEDNALCQKVLRQILKKCGCSVDVASDGVEAVQMWTRNPKGYDAILMDIRMPNMDGITATRILREKGCGIPIVAVTAERGEAERQKCLMVGMNSFLSKPILVKDLISKLRDFCFADS
ncbi:hypothetical protein HK104_000945, partial [Borealophlyctis nickersoniae]